jgi:hypothetical protein
VAFRQLASRQDNSENAGTYCFKKGLPRTPNTPKRQVVLQLWQEMVIEARENFGDEVVSKAMLRKDIVP